MIGPKIAIAVGSAPVKGVPVLKDWMLSAGAPATATENPAGTLNLTGDGTHYAIADKAISGLVVGRTYSLNFQGVGTGFSQVGTTQGGNQTLSNIASSVGSNQRTFVATATTHWVRFYKLAAALFQATNIKVAQVGVFILAAGLVINNMPLMSGGNPLVI